MEEPLSCYLPAFKTSSEPFVTFYQVSNKDEQSYTVTRGQMWLMATRMAYILKVELGLKKGDTHIHLFKGNSVGDLALRLANVMIGSIPVTINWDSDPEDRILYKIESSKAHVVIVQSQTPIEQLEAVKSRASGDVTIISLETMMSNYEQGPFLDPSQFEKTLTEEDTRIIIYTSGSSGEPKGVRLPYRAYVTNRLTFESFLQLEGPSHRFTPILVNPMHHTNSTAFTDWALRRPGTHLHLFERYTTRYWAVLAQIALGIEGGGGRGSDDGGVDTIDMSSIESTIASQKLNHLRIIAPTVSRHFDFLEGLIQEGRLPIDPDVLKMIAPVVTFLIGSAPVGPTTVSRLMNLVGRLPTIRFGSTETCLQVMGTPLDLPHEAAMEAFKRGWEAPEQEGFYVGRPHPPYNEVMVAQGIDRNDHKTYLVECAEGTKGYLVTRGRNLMSGYVQGVEATNKAIDREAGGWYTNLGDVFFWLRSKHDGGKDYYWVTRTSNLLIKGGSNYSYDQISNELTQFVAKHYNLPSSSFAVAAVGLRLSSEHEDDCLVTLDLIESEAQTKLGQMDGASFILEAKKGGVSKGSKPDRWRLGPIPRNFKGDINWRSLEAEWKAYAAEAT